MLFRPTADENLEAVRSLLDGWNVEADRFRQAALAARHGEAPSPLIASAAAEALEGLTSLLDEIDSALDHASPGSRQFSALLQTQLTASALLESVSTSYDHLDRFVATEFEAPTRIAHELRVAAE